MIRPEGIGSREDPSAGKSNKSIYVLAPQPIAQFGLRVLFDSQPDLQVVGESGSCRDMDLDSAGIDVVIVDPELEDACAADVLSRITWMRKAARQKLPGDRPAGRRHQQACSTDTGNPVHDTRRCDTERRGRVAGALTVRMRREITLAYGRFPGSGGRALARHRVEGRVDGRLRPVDTRATWEKGVYGDYTLYLCGLYKTLHFLWKETQPLLTGRWISRCTPA